MEKTKAEIKEKFIDGEYPIHVIGRHIAITEPMKAYAMEKLSKIERFGGRVIDATITMDVQKLLHTVDFIVDVNNTKIKVSGCSDDMYASIDLAIARLVAKVRRYTSRLHDHHAKGISEIEMNVNIVKVNPADVMSDLIEEETLKAVEAELKPHVVVSREKKRLKTLNHAEAIMKMELSEDAFMIYKCEEDRKLKVIYRRSDDNYGIIELESEPLYDPVRKKWVACTPEEIIRQRLIRYMIDKLGYLSSLMAIEKELAQLPHLKMTSTKEIAKRRADIIVYAKGALTPLLLIECKALPLTPAFAQQVIGYNAFVGAPYVALANETQVLTGWYHPDAGIYRFEQGLPTLSTLMER